MMTGSVHSIWITEKGYSYVNPQGEVYKYEDNVRHIDAENVEIVWKGQKMGMKDHLVIPGTLVFIRDHVNVPFSLIGILEEKKLIKSGDHKKKQPHLYTLKVHKYPLPQKFTSTGSGSGHFKRAAMESLGLSICKQQQVGIMTHAADNIDRFKIPVVK
jgi:hypothetical protein